MEFFVLFIGSGREADKLRCGVPAFVLSVNVQMKVMRNGIQAHFREEVGWGGVGCSVMGGGTRETGRSTKSCCFSKRSVKSNSADRFYKQN